MCKDCWFSKYNRVLLHYSAAAAAAVAYIPLSGCGVYPSLSGGEVYPSLSAAAADTHHCSVDTDELFHAYFLYVST